MRNRILILSLFSLFASQMHGMRQEEAPIRQRALAFAMAMHPRLGDGLPAHALPQELFKHIIEESFPELKLIREFKAKPQDERDNDLILSAILGNLSLMKILIAAGANVNRQHGPFLMTPLIMAIVNNRNEDVVRTLLEANANVNLRDATITHSLPLECALQHENNEGAELLREYGAE